MYQNIFFDVKKQKFHLWDDQKGYLVLPYNKYAYVKHSNGQHVSLYGDRLKRVTKWDKEDPTLQYAAVMSSLSGSSAVLRTLHWFAVAARVL